MRYVLPFIVSMAVAMAVLPMLAKLAIRWDLVDRPGARKVHSAPIPRIGGIAMAIGVMISASATIMLQSADFCFLLAGAVLVLFGALDDRWDLDYRWKFLGQLIAVVIVVVFGGVRIEAITLQDRVLVPCLVSMPFTVIFLVGITNAVNLADGLDGLGGRHDVSVPVRRRTPLQCGRSDYEHGDLSSRSPARCSDSCVSTRSLLLYSWATRGASCSGSPSAFSASGPRKMPTVR